MEKSIIIANDLQYGNDLNKVLIEDELSNNLREMLRNYREHPNHIDIDPVLDYLEADLNKYENKPKSAIVVDFN